MFSVIFGLVLIRWVFALELEWINIDEELWEFWLPCFCCLFSVLFGLRKRLRILTFKKDNIRDAYVAVAVLSMVAPAIISQIYLADATGKIVHLKTVSEIFSVPAERFYSIDAYLVAPDKMATFRNSYTSGKYNRDLNFECYHVVPITDYGADNSFSNVWYGIKKTKRINNKGSDETKNFQESEFFSQCLREFDDYNFY